MKFLILFLMMISLETNAQTSRSFEKLISVGSIQEFAGNCPSGWLETNGQAVSRTQYANLFNQIGVTYGAGDNSTTFNLPNLPRMISGYANFSGATITSLCTASPCTRSRESGSLAQFMTVTRLGLSSYQVNLTNLKPNTSFFCDVKAVENTFSRSVVYPVINATETDSSGNGFQGQQICAVNGSGVVNCSNDHRMQVWCQGQAAVGKNCIKF